MSVGSLGRTPAPANSNLTPGGENDSQSRGGCFNRRGSAAEVLVIALRDIPAVGHALLEAVLGCDALADGHCAEQQATGCYHCGDDGADGNFVLHVGFVSLVLCNSTASVARSVVGEPDPYRFPYCHNLAAEHEKPALSRTTAGSLASCQLG